MRIAYIRPTDEQIIEWLERSIAQDPREGRRVVVGCRSYTWKEFLEREVKPMTPIGSLYIEALRETVWRHGWQEA
jgi:hypothetical protein